MKILVCYDIPEQKIRSKMDTLLGAIGRTSEEEALRGLEGTAARIYFSAFPELLGNAFPWPGRQQHPAYEPVNALLNYGYAFLKPFPLNMDRSAFL